MNGRCPQCGAELKPGKPTCAQCGWRPGPPAIDAIVIDADSPAAREQGLDTLYVGLGLFVLGLLVLIGGLFGFLTPLMNHDLDLENLDTFITGMALVCGLTIALFVAAAVLFAVSRKSAAARAGGVAAAVAGTIISSVASVLVIVLVVIIVIIAAILAFIASIMNICGCKPSQQASLHSPPSASAFDDTSDYRGLRIQR